MATILSDRILEGNEHWQFLAGDSDEAKPTGLADGSMFLETDKGGVQFYNKSSATWIPAGGSPEAQVEEG